MRSEERRVGKECRARWAPESRRRHTRCGRDWSSDVCSSDLIFREIPVQFGRQRVKLENLRSNEPIKEDSVSSGYATFRLGSADRTVTGIKEYRISYSYTIGDEIGRASCRERV